MTDDLEILGRCIMNMPPALRAADPSPGIREMRDALDMISRQTKTSEMSAGQIDDADFEGAYNMMIAIARKATAFGAR